VAVGTVVGAAAGFVRIAQGGHFLSDVVFAGLLMALTALLVHGLMFWRPRASTNAPIKAEA
jgi:lipid A 4'-phosphatase